MTTITIDRAVVEQALDAVQEFKRRWWMVPAFGNKVNKATREAITNAHSPIFELEHALRSALEQPAQKRPQNCGTGYCSCIECVMEQQDEFGKEVDAVDTLIEEGWIWDGDQWQRPPAPRTEQPSIKAKAYIVHRAMCEPELEWNKPKDCLSAEPLYTAPPAPRKPLTDEEIERNWQFLHDEEGNPPDHHDFARAIEAKLREKNYG